MTGAKAFMFVCAGLLMLALAYRQGAISVGASRNRIVTRELVVTDDAGQQRATITVDAGGPHLSLSDESGRPTVMLTGGTDRNTFGKGPYGGYLSFYDTGHTRRAQLGFRLENGPDGWPVADEGAGVAVYGKDGRKTWSALP